MDDFTYAGTTEWETRVIGTLKRRFKISACYSSTFNYLGLGVEQTSDEIVISQDKYICEIQPIDISIARKKERHEHLTKEERKQLKGLSGQMLWVTNNTRPDMSFESCVMANAGKNPTKKYVGC